MKSGTGKFLCHFLFLNCNLCPESKLRCLNKMCYRFVRNSSLGQEWDYNLLVCWLWCGCLRLMGIALGSPIGWGGTLKSNLGVRLSPREHDIARLVSQEKLDKEIARDLQISHCTVRYHINELREKLNVRGRVGIAVWIIKHEWSDKT